MLPRLALNLLETSVSGSQVMSYCVSLASNCLLNLLLVFVFNLLLVFVL